MSCFDYAATHRPCQGISCHCFGSILSAKVLDMSIHAWQNRGMTSTRIRTTTDRLLLELHTINTLLQHTPHDSPEYDDLLVDRLEIVRALNEEN